MMLGKQISSWAGCLKLLLLLAAGWLMGCAVAPAATHTIVMQNNRFVPNDLTIATGDTVTWPGGSTIHTVTGTGSDPLCGGTWIRTGNNCVKTFSTAGTFNYRCSIHGAYGMSGVVRVVAPNTIPVTSITSPTNGAIFATDAVFPITATATDTNGSVSLVEFFAGASLLGSKTNTPFTLSVSNFAAGVYSLTSRATDNLSAVGNSAPVSITIVTPATVVLTNAFVTNGQYQLTYSASTGLRYTLQGSTNLINWTSLVTNTATSGSVTLIDTNATNFGFRFYRVQRLN